MLLLLLLLLLLLSHLLIATHNTMQSVVTRQAPITLEWKEDTSVKIKQANKNTHDD